MCIASSQRMEWMTGKAAVTHLGSYSLEMGRAYVEANPSHLISLCPPHSSLFSAVLYFGCPSEPAAHVILMWIEDTITSHNEHLVTVVSSLLQRST